ncbi:hypothetical protein [Burkholderia pseudomallei]|uniref:hypothetical protein n=1 Tax=Burkholderia pseudomallei TaxID=28450 RepID=UPI001E5B1A4C|nr:hypothetical protein [Burkholderia pseudomallei]
MNKTLTAAERNAIERAISEVELCCQFALANELRAILATQQPEPRDEVTCADCKEKLNPMWVLKQLSQAEHRYHELHARYHDELKRLSERSRTKCQHCGEMTRISKS